MARWSDAMKFDVPTLHEYRDYLDAHGVYELGYVIGDIFYWKYVGKAEKQTLYARLRQYHYPSSETKLPPVLRSHLYGGSNRVWFHVFRSEDPAENERQLLRRNGIGGNGGDYAWNRKHEG